MMSLLTVMSYDSADVFAEAIVDKTLTRQHAPVFLGGDTAFDRR